MLRCGNYFEDEARGNIAHVTKYGNHTAGTRRASDASIEACLFLCLQLPLVAMDAIRAETLLATRLFGRIAEDDQAMREDAFG